MSELIRDSNLGRPGEGLLEQRSRRISVPEISRRLDVGRQAAYAMLEQGIIPGIRLGRRWIITRHAYEEWERTCGTRSAALVPGLHTDTELGC